jgi:ribosomal protein L7/L12
VADLPLYGRVDELQRRVARLEAAVEALAAATGVTVPQGATEFYPDVLALVRDGKRVQAVKAAAERLGLSLQDATEYVGRAEGSA